MNNELENKINEWPGLKAKRNFFSKNMLKKIKSQINKAKFDCVYQERESHYSHVFKSTNDRITESDEVYIANFYQAVDNDTKLFLKNIVAPIIGKEIKRVMPKVRNIMTPQLMRLSPGSFLRTHVDDYAGEAGYTIFINEGWKWDFGGILSFVSQGGDTALPIFPEDNLAIIRDESKKSFHFVSQQTAYSNSDQYLFVGWASDKISHEKFDYLPI